VAIKLDVKKFILQGRPRPSPRPIVSMTWMLRRDLLAAVM